MGHKILYELIPSQTEDGITTYEGILWQDLLHPLSRKEKRQIVRRYKETIKESIQLHEESTRGIRFLSRIFAEVDKIADSLRHKRLYHLLKKLGFDWKKVPISKLLKYLLYPNLSGTLCFNCLKEGRLSYLAWDHSCIVDEVHCPACGLVQEEL